MSPAARRGLPGEERGVGSAGGSRRAVLLDRDGVVNGMWYNAEHGLIDAPANPDQFELLPGVAAGIEQLNRLGFLTVVVSNQPGVAKGKLSPALLDAVTAKMYAELARLGARLDGVFYCRHHPEAVVPEYRIRCDCRKPLPGLLLEAGRTLGLDLARSYLVGDGLIDIRAGKAAGCRTIWLGRWKCDICQVMAREGVAPDLIAANLHEAVELIRAEG